MKKVLLTGFGPFADFEINPTAIIVEQLLTLNIENVTIKTLILEVDFDKALPDYESLLNEFKPDLILNLGLSATTNAIKLEHVALNIGYDNYTENTENKTFFALNTHAQNALITSIDTSKLATQICEKGVPCKRSNHAGTYLCNYIYFHSLQWTLLQNAKALFIHIPFTTELVSQFCLEKKQAYPSIPQALIVKAIQEIITFSTKSEFV